ncbi:methyltransferase [Sphaerisporangium siamense]|uniref:SAM-dependent methyltransferase n=1 Tax=Sphaerisporangium siamense TaxID=795645 RepID=A0A7W7D3C6_9ACTN|nr:methyltransferase domain-containing protein [Sphaerisporangium siamense]MBB4699554.1 SAM-dependent methyltransferase [Sphaerisporangium siamense]GII86968.1 methyltransferase [Sphaerisporangium siamense]
MSTHTSPGASGDPVTSLVALLDAVDAQPGAKELRDRSYELLRLAPGACVVDVGCGAGRAVAELNARGMRAIGVDAAGRMVEAARRRGPELDVRLGDAGDLPLEDGQAAGYRADKVYHELADPARALAEARRVLGRDGRVVLVGQDWDTFVIDSDDWSLTRTIVHARADAVTNPRAARGYRNLLLDAGFTDVAVEVHTGVFTGTAMFPLLPMLSGVADAARRAGAVTARQARGWIEEQAERGRRGRLFLAVPMFLASATRP